MCVFFLCNDNIFNGKNECVDVDFSSEIIIWSLSGAALLSSRRILPFRLRETTEFSTNLTNQKR